MRFEINLGTIRFLIELLNLDSEVESIIKSQIIHS